MINTSCHGCVWWLRGGARRSDEEKRCAPHGAEGVRQALASAKGDDESVGRAVLE